MPSLTSSAVRQALRLEVKAAGFLGFSGGLVSLLGWVFSVPRFIDWVGNGITIKTNAAICATAIGAAVLLLVASPARWKARAAAILSIVVMALAAMTLSQHAFGWNLGIDTALFNELPGARATAAPNRMGVPASTCFLALGVGLLTLKARGSANRLPRVLGSLVVLVSGLSLVGFLYGASELFDVANLTGIATHTAIILNSLGWAVVAMSLDRDPEGVLLASGPGGVLARRLMPMALVIPLLLGFAAVVVQRAGLLQPPLAFAGVAIATVLVLTFFIVTATSSVERSALLLAEGRAAMLNREREARTAAERAVQAKDEFIAVISHELRTPLNTMAGWSELLKNASLDAADRARAAEAIGRSVRMQAMLIDDLLDISGIASGKLRLEIAPVSLMRVLDAAVHECAKAAQRKQITITRVNDGPDDVTLPGDARRLQQVVSNLLSNAVKFSAAGGAITVAIRRREAVVEIVVADSGEGIAAEHLPFVFERFHQGDSSRTRKHGGLGLGLTIVKHLIELHGGSVSVKSGGPGQGAAFTVVLPSPDATAEDLVQPALSVPSRAAIDLRTITVLVVDDNRDARELTCRLLAEYGAVVEVAGSGDEALERLAVEVPDVLLSDISMPGMDGYELIRQVRVAHGALAAIAISAFVRPDDRLRSLEAGFDLHLPKPVNPHELAAAIRSLTPLERQLRA